MIREKWRRIQRGDKEEEDDARMREGRRGLRAKISKHTVQQAPAMLLVVWVKAKSGARTDDVQGGEKRWREGSEEKKRIAQNDSSKQALKTAVQVWAWEGREMAKVHCEQTQDKQNKSYLQLPRASQRVDDNGTRGSPDLLDVRAGVNIRVLLPQFLANSLSHAIICSPPDAVVVQAGGTDEVGSRDMETVLQKTGTGGRVRRFERCHRYRCREQKGGIYFSLLLSARSPCPLNSLELSDSSVQLHNCKAWSCSSLCSLELIRASPWKTMLIRVSIAPPPLHRQRGVAGASKDG